MSQGGSSQRDISSCNSLDMFKRFPVWTTVQLFPCPQPPGGPSLLKYPPAPPGDSLGQPQATSLWGGPSPSMGNMPTHWAMSTGHSPSSSRDGTRVGMSTLSQTSSLDGVPAFPHTNSMLALALPHRLPLQEGGWGCTILLTQETFYKNPRGSSRTLLSRISR